MGVTSGVRNRKITTLLAKLVWKNRNRPTCRPWKWNGTTSKVDRSVGSVSIFRGKLVKISSRFLFRRFNACDTGSILSLQIV
jgi:hypothetical protein